MTSTTEDTHGERLVAMSRWFRSLRRAHGASERAVSPEYRSADLGWLGNEYSFLLAGSGPFDDGRTAEDVSEPLRAAGNTSHGDYHVPTAAETVTGCPFLDSLPANERDNYLRHPGS